LSSTSHEQHISWQLATLQPQKCRTYVLAACQQHRPLTLTRQQLQLLREVPSYVTASCAAFQWSVVPLQCHLASLLTRLQMLVTR
jgi:hypothetical protein